MTHTLVDFHAHILPGVDHGSDSMATSHAQLAMARAAGVDRIIATPHFYPHVHSLDDFIERRNDAYLALHHTFRRLDFTPPDIRLGAEVLLCEGLEELPVLSRLAVFGTKTILIELPFNDFIYKYAETVGALIDKGYDVVLAHAERYPVDNIEAVLQFGAKIQLNAAALARTFMSRSVRSWLSRGLVYAVGSDIHMTDKTAYRQYSRAVSKLGAYLTKICDYTNAVFDGAIDIYEELHRNA